MNTETTGRGMLYAGWLIVLAILVFFLGDWEQGQSNPNRDLSGSERGGVREVVLERNRYGHYILDAQVNGSDVTFLLDTGATDLVFTEPQARELGLTRGLKYWVSTANGDIQVFRTTVDQLRIGNIVLHNLNASINPHMDGEALLGMSALVDLEWSQRGNQLFIRQ